jgi:hypothetical protein
MVRGGGKGLVEVIEEINKLVGAAETKSVQKEQVSIWI